VKSDRQTLMAIPDQLEGGVNHLKDTQRIPGLGNHELPEDQSSSKRQDRHRQPSQRSRLGCTCLVPMGRSMVTKPRSPGVESDQSRRAARDWCLRMCVEQSEPSRTRESSLMTQVEAGSGSAVEGDSAASPQADCSVHGDSIQSDSIDQLKRLGRRVLTGKTRLTLL
jgi:hypothetical protein